VALRGVSGLLTLFSLPLTASEPVVVAFVVVAPVPVAFQNRDAIAERVTVGGGGVTALAGDELRPQKPVVTVGWWDGFVAVPVARIAGMYEGGDTESAPVMSPMTCHEFCGASASSSLGVAVPSRN